MIFSTKPRIVLIFYSRVWESDLDQIDRRRLDRAEYSAAAV
jgi:hypothetical protein